jgi:hypothetical protein
MCIRRLTVLVAAIAVAFAVAFGASAALHGQGGGPASRAPSPALITSAQGQQGPPWGIGSLT